MGEVEGKEEAEAARRHIFFLPSFFQVQLNPTVHLGSILSKSQGISHIASDLFHMGPCSERIKVRTEGEGMMGERGRNE